MTIEKTLNSSKVKKEKEGFIIITKYNIGIESVCMT
jgi:hypothetical protein